MIDGVRDLDRPQTIVSERERSGFPERCLGERPQLLLEALDRRPPVGAQALHHLELRKEIRFSAQSIALLILPHQLGHHRGVGYPNAALRAVNLDGEAVSAPLTPTRLEVANIPGRAPQKCEPIILAARELPDVSC